MFFEGFFVYIRLSWPAALEHGKIEENSVNSGVFKGLGRQGNWKHCKELCLERFYCDTCVNYRVLRENIAKYANTLQKTRALEDFVEKMQITVQNVVCCGYLKFPSLGGPHAGEKRKKHPLGGSQGGGGNRGPGRPGLRMAAKLFEIEMQITCTNV